MGFCSAGKCLYIKGELIHQSHTLNVTVQNEWFPIKKDKFFLASS